MNENKNIAKKRGNTQYQIFMITQELERHIGSNAEEINRAIEEKVGENLLWCYTNVHDGDTSPVWDLERKIFYEVEKLVHAHSIVRVKNKMTVNSLAKLLEIDPQYVEKPKAGNGAESKMLAYLVHARDSDKKLYDPRTVVASRDAIPYIDIYCRYKKQWDKDKARHRTFITEIDEDYIIEKIEEGEIVEKKQILLTDEYYRVYSRHNRRIDKALEIASQRRQLKNAEDIRNGQLVQVIYVTGRPDRGKSYFCDELIEGVRHQILGREGWLLCDANSDNCLDKYEGQEILLIDDARGDAMKANQWTRLLDPRRANEGSARYHDRLVSAKLIIFNAYKPFDNFFYFTKGIGKNDKSEALDQFIRRVLLQITVNGRDDIDIAISDCVPSERYMEIMDNDGNVEKRCKIKTEHSFVTICEHQTVENAVALAAALIAANQHAGKVTDAMMAAVASVGVPCNNVIEIRAREIERHAVLEEHKEHIKNMALLHWRYSGRHYTKDVPTTNAEWEEYNHFKELEEERYLKDYYEKKFAEEARMEAEEKFEDEHFWDEDSNYEMTVEEMEALEEEFRAMI